MLYSDPFLGYMDYTVRKGGNEYYAECEEKLSAVAKKSRKYGYLFDTAAKLSGVLKYKYELGVKTREAYKAGDKAELLRLANEDYSGALRAISAFAKSFEHQWYLDNKTYGFEVHDIRLGGLHRRVESCRRRLIDYANGKIDRIAELEEAILPSPKSVEGESAYNNFYRNIATSNAL
jgi:hypothetical protein